MERIPGWLCAGALAVAALCAVMLAGGGQSAHAVTASDQLPDLVADPPTHATLDYYTYQDNTHDLLLRFDGYVHNVGPGALDIRGSRASATDETTPPMTPLQRVYRTDTTFHDDAMPSNTQLFYSTADGHNHWHLQNVARYSLWNQAKSAEVAPSLKVGFCLMDSEHVNTAIGPAQAQYADGNAPQPRHFCQKNNKIATSVVEGVSAGWRDIYDRGLYFQWVVVSDVQPGSYRLREDVDPTNIVHEGSETNAPAYSASPVTIPGYVARAITAPATPYGQSQQLTLGADSYGTPGARHFRIVTPPAHGTLSVATGSDFTDPSVTYTPAKGYSGPDQSTYQALDSTSSYPIHPGTATVALSVGSPPIPSVVIDGAPSSLATGHGVQLHATVANDFPGVTWSVDGVNGGNAYSGTITSSGFYKAPLKVPASGHVTIAARSASGAHDQRVLKITWPISPGPSPGTPGSGYVEGSLLAPLQTMLQGNLLAASVTPGRAGIVSIRARAGKRRLGSCRAKVPKGRLFTCRLYVPHGTKLRKLRVVAQLMKGHKVLATVHRVGAPSR